MRRHDLNGHDAIKRTIVRLEDHAHAASSYNAQDFVPADAPQHSRIVRRREVTGRPRAFYRKLRMSRIALRELGNQGMVPGLVKSSW